VSEVTLVIKGSATVMCTDNCGFIKTSFQCCRTSSWCLD